MKKVGIIIIGLLLAVLLMIVSVNSVGGTKSGTQNTNVVQSSTNTQVQNSTQVIQVTATPEVTSEPTAEPTEEPAEPKAEIGELDKGTAMSEEEVITMTELNLDTVPYKNKYTTESCTITDKKAYFSANQIYYSLKIHLKEANKTIDYYVGYSTYNALELNDKITVEYESFDNGIVSITSISNR